MATGTCCRLLGQMRNQMPTHDRNPIQHNPEITPIRHLTCEQPSVCQEFVSVQQLTA